MTTESKIIIGLVGIPLMIETAIYAVVMKRSDERDQERHEAFMAKLNELHIQTDALENE